MEMCASCGTVYVPGERAPYCPHPWLVQPPPEQAHEPIQLPDGEG
jgi:uncharacterized OB-fold protein